jgi:hypothetical protein
MTGYEMGLTNNNFIIIKQLSLSENAFTIPRIAERLAGIVVDGFCCVT